MHVTLQGRELALAPIDLGTLERIAEIIDAETGPGNFKPLLARAVAILEAAGVPREAIGGNWREIDEAVAAVLREAGLELKPPDQVRGDAAGNLAAAAPVFEPESAA